MTRHGYEPSALYDLLEAYALGAVDDDERAQIDELLSHDEAAREEVEVLSRVTVLLDSSDRPGPEVWRAIESAIAGRARHEARVVPLRRRTSTWVITAVAAAAAALAAFLATNTVLSSRTLPVSPISRVERAARAAAVNPDAQRAVLTTPDGEFEVDVVVLPDGRGFVLGGQLPATPDQYSLVALTLTGEVVLGALDARVEVASFALPATAVALVVEDVAGLHVAVGGAPGPGRDSYLPAGSLPAGVGGAPRPDVGAPPPPGGTSGTQSSSPPTEAPPTSLPPGDGGGVVISLPGLELHFNW